MMRMMVIALSIALSLPLYADEVAQRLRTVDSPSGTTLQNPTSEQIADLYFSLSDLAFDDQREQMWALSSDTKAALWKYNIEHYLRNHPELSNEARRVLHEGLVLLSTPAWFDEERDPLSADLKPDALTLHKRRTTEVLPSQVIREVFIRLGPDPSSTVATAPRRGHAASPFLAIPHTEGGECTCADWFECWYHHATCLDAWCTPVRHCGWYGNEMCIGKCKFS